MTLLEQIKKQMMAALKSKSLVEKEILRVAVGEIETAASRVDSFDDAASQGVLKKLVKSNEETLSLETDDAKRAVLLEEIRILKALLPKSLGVDEIAAMLGTVSDAIRAAANDGQATGVAMKHLKSQGAEVAGKDVGEAVRRLRA